MASTNYYYYYNYIHSLESHQDPHESSPDRNVVLQGSKNYQEWRQAMNLKLEKTRTLWFVHGTDTAVMNQGPIYGKWKTRKELVLSWILDSISEEIKISIAEDSSNNEVGLWKALMKIFSHQDHQSIISDIKEEIKSLKQETRTLMEYKIKFDALWMEYDMMLDDENNDKSKREQERAKRFLDGLNDTFKATRSSIMEEKPFPSLERVFYLAAQEDDEARILVTRIQVIVLSEIHEHALTSTPPGTPYSCDGCKEGGCGRSYRCEEKNCSGYVLHEECASAVLHRENPESHPFFKGEVFAFLEKPIGHPRFCDACRMEVQGFVYYREETKKDTGLDLHPCCLKLRHNIPYEDSGATKTLTLQRDVPKKCDLCKRKKVGDDGEPKGWSYVTSDGDCYHVSCFKKWFLEKFRDDYFSEKKVVVSKMQSNVVESNNMKVFEVGEGSNSSKKRSSSVVKKTVVKIAPVVLKLIFSAIFGDPVSFVLTILEGIFNTFN
ncbi:uncharacterized protein LOC130976505 [Arachis stenosperma]|uniref:uncharacterized protein LOC130976505 n=1 Tax=Arachis stenosperma TaxID=217475 RepID=UPI0025AC5BE2|nr:uncharacterized protein LOC130976505 [Arachis stenosperma]